MLTSSSLKCFDRHLTGVNRKPLHSFSWGDSKNLVVVLKKVESRPLLYMSPGKYQNLSFAVEQHSVSGAKQATFVAGSVKEKEEWVDAIEGMIGRQSTLHPKRSPNLPLRSPVRSSPRFAHRDSGTLSLDDSSIV